MSSDARPDRVPTGTADGISIDDLVAALNASDILRTLEISNEDLLLARSDPNLLETLRITYQIITMLDDAAVLATFYLLPKADQANFIRWIGMIDDPEARRDRTTTLVFALEEGPFSADLREETRGSSRASN